MTEGAKRPLRILAVLLVTATASCSMVPDFVANSLGLPVREKIVMSKLGSNELVAVDGTRCIVSGGRFEEVEISESVACFWSEQPREELP